MICWSGTEMVGAGRDLLELVLTLDNLKVLGALGMDVRQPCLLGLFA